MGRRIGQVAGALAFVLMLGRLGRLLETGPLQPQWQMILAAATFLGAVGWWLLSQVTSSTPLRLTVFALGGVLLALRIIAADTLNYVFLPGPETLDAISAEMDEAFRTIRSGVPPVLPRPGVISVLSLVMWSIGGLYSWGSTRGPYAAMWLPSLVMYLQFAVWDRREVPTYWLVGGALVLSLGLISLALESRGESGRARDDGGRPLPRRTVGLAVAITAILSVSAIALATTAKDFVSEYGNLPWRSGGSGFGDGPGGGINFDGLVGLQQMVINRDNTPVFAASVDGDLPDSGLYWRMQTLDVFNGDEWSSSAGSQRYREDEALASEDDVYQGTTYQVTQRVTVRKLSSAIAPTLGVPVALPSADDPDVLEPEDFHILPSAEIAYLNGLQSGDQYQVTTWLGDRTADLGALASVDGELSPMFQAAFDAGEFPHNPDTVNGEALAPTDIDRYTDLPDDDQARIRQLARQITNGAATDFERAWILQSWFRETGDFTYSTDVSTGHGSLVLQDWLTDPESENYRTGYCEQFAASMAVMLRALDVPSRVIWGFTPGDTRVTEDGFTEVIVRDTNAHAWVEVFLEPYGWFPFDPTPRGEFLAPSITAGFDAIQRVPEFEADPIEAPTDTPRSNFGGELILDEPGATTDFSPPTNWWLIGAILVPLLVFASPVFKAIRRRNRLARIKEGDITAAWDEIVDRLTDLGEEIPETMTPMEIARAKDRALVPLARSYSEAIYGERSVGAKEADLTGVEWWIDREYDASQRLFARFNWRSLFKG